jgi:hypothetical protein
MRFSFHGTEVPDTPSVFTISFKFKIHNWYPIIFTNFWWAYKSRSVSESVFFGFK